MPKAYLSQRKHLNRFIEKDNNWGEVTPKKQCKREVIMYNTKLKALVVLMVASCLFTCIINVSAVDAKMTQKVVLEESQGTETEDTTPHNEPATELPTEEQPTESIVKNGFYTEDGKTRYYNNGKLHIGFLKFDDKKYYFNSFGNMITGSQKIDDSYYYFNKKGIMKTGFIKINSKKYYYNEKTGKKVFGFKKIGKYKYYLKKKNGSVYSGFLNRKYKGKKILTYYDSKGRLKTGTFKVSKVEYKSTKKTGKIYSVRNLAKALCQLPELPTGCEITSWTMMVNFAGVNISKTAAADIMPKSSDPNKGFMGSPYLSTGVGMVVYPDGLKSITKKRLGSYVNLSGCSLNKIKTKLNDKHLVLVWVNPLDGFLSHTVALTGYNKSGFFYNDPWTGKKEFMSYEKFKTIWTANSSRALSY